MPPHKAYLTRTSASRGNGRVWCSIIVFNAIRFACAIRHHKITSPLGSRQLAALNRKEGGAIDRQYLSIHPSHCQADFVYASNAFQFGLRFCNLCIICNDIFGFLSASDFDIRSRILDVLSNGLACSTYDDTGCLEHFRIGISSSNQCRPLWLLSSFLFKCLF